MQTKTSPTKTFTFGPGSIESITVRIVRRPGGGRLVTRKTPLWHPRGEVKYDLNKAKVGDRVRVIRTGATGTVTYVVPRGKRSPGFGVRVLWDGPFHAEGVVVAAAFDLEKIV